MATCIFGTVSTVHADNIFIKIDNNVRSYDQVPIMKGDRVFIPIRGISEDTGASVKFTNEDKKVTIMKNDKTISFNVGSNVATVNGEVKELPESFILNGRTMLPLRFINEMLGYRVDWSNTDKSVTITTDRGAAVNQIFTSSQKYIGVPYLYGGNYERDKKFDCSSFIQKVFAENGLQLPRTSSQQSTIGKAVAKAQAKPGDLVFFDTAGQGTVSHVAIYVDENTLLHATTSLGVNYTPYSKYWQDRTLMIRNVLQID